MQKLQCNSMISMILLINKSSVVVNFEIFGERKKSEKTWSIQHNLQQNDQSNIQLYHIRMFSAWNLE